MSKSNGASPKPTKWVHFRAPLRGPMGESITKIDDTIADWRWAPNAPLLMVFYFGTAAAKDAAVRAIEESGQSAVLLLEVPIDNIANFASTTTLRQESPIVRAPANLIERIKA